MSLKPTVDAVVGIQPEDPIREHFAEHDRVAEHARALEQPVRRLEDRRDVLEPHSP
jgi:hypothetical protein